MALVCNGWQPHFTLTGDPRPGGACGLRRRMVRVPCPRCWAQGRILERSVVEHEGLVVQVAWVWVMCSMCRGSRKVEVRA